MDFKLKSVEDALLQSEILYDDKNKEFIGIDKELYKFDINNNLYIKDIDTNEKK